MVKQIIFGIFCLFFLNNTAFSQKKELILSTGIGINPALLDNQTEWIIDESFTRVIPVMLDFNYRFFLEKKFRLIAGTGLHYTNNRFLQPVTSDYFGYNVDDVIFYQKHLVIPIRLGGEVKFGSRNTLGFYYQLKYNLALQNEKSYSESNQTSISGSLTYDYQLTNRTDNFLSHQLSLFGNMHLFSGHFLTWSFGYEFRPVSGNYDYSTGQSQRLTDQNTGAVTTIDTRSEINNEEIKNNLLHVGIGLSKQF
ncbi:MAG: hypothetical protein IPN79_02805 [Saprospiraceae bacterium]|nr:hypothetical protein [Saprospiraceae bacterium]